MGSFFGCRPSGLSCVVLLQLLLPSRLMRVTPGREMPGALNTAVPTLVPRRRQVKVPFRPVSVWPPMVPTGMKPPVFSVLWVFTIATLVIRPDALKSVASCRETAGVETRRLLPHPQARLIDCDLHSPTLLHVSWGCFILCDGEASVHGFSWGFAFDFALPRITRHLPGHTTGRKR